MPWNKTSTMDQKRLFIKDYIRGAFVMAETVPTLRNQSSDGLQMGRPI